ncbi:MAG: hypothetical protein CSA13_01030 [Clostridiales bacterium]|nr:MAG: hypothetical protein CSA13_01030 [Clostridiales bacterium]
MFPIVELLIFTINFFLFGRNPSANNIFLVFMGMKIAEAALQIKHEGVGFQFRRYWGILYSLLLSYYTERPEQFIFSSKAETLWSRLISTDWIVVIGVCLFVSFLNFLYYLTDGNDLI